ncbi:MAG: hypothetical protein IPH35_25780 [Rhodoferax sp.]|nr:hypothetical protein [Rhodoferax sp.]
MRMAQILAAEYDLHPPYSTLTRWVRQAELRQPPKRSGEYHFEPGQEMQHDTSPHKMEVAGKSITAQCAGLTLRTRGVCLSGITHDLPALRPRTFVARSPVHGRHLPTLRDRQYQRHSRWWCWALMRYSPEMAAFARALGFKFMAHRVNDPDRKVRIERPFAWVEDNFLPGRSFSFLMT